MHTSLSPRKNHRHKNTHTHARKRKRGGRERSSTIRRATDATTGRELGHGPHRGSRAPAIGTVARRGADRRAHRYIIMCTYTTTAAAAAVTIARRTDRPTPWRRATFDFLLVLTPRHRARFQRNRFASHEIAHALIHTVGRRRAAADATVRLRRTSRGRVRL